MRHIKTVICENCGKEFESRIHNAKFCCRRCANQRHEANRKAPRTFRCPHNHEVTCSLKNCGACGWNPDVAQRRMDKILSFYERYPDLKKIKYDKARKGWL